MSKRSLIPWPLCGLKARGALLVVGVSQLVMLSAVSVASAADYQREIINTALSTSAWTQVDTGSAVSARVRHIDICSRLSKAMYVSFDAAGATYRTVQPVTSFYIDALDIRLPLWVKGSDDADTAEITIIR